MSMYISCILHISMQFNFFTTFLKKFLNLAIFLSSWDKKGVILYYFLYTEPVSFSKHLS